MSAPPVLYFDLDGTLIDPTEGIAAGVRHAFAALGEPPPTDAQTRACIGPPLRESFAHLLGPARAARVEEAVALFRARYGADGLLRCAVYPGVRDALAAAAAAGYRAYVVTAKPQPFAERIAAALGLDAHLAGVYGAHADGRFDDKAVLLRHVRASEGLGDVPGVMVGDRRHDVLAARAVGVPSVGVTWGFGTPAELLEAGADALCASAAELLPAARRLLERGLADRLD